MTRAQGPWSSGSGRLDWRGAWRLVLSDVDRYTHLLAQESIAGAGSSGRRLVPALRAFALCQGLQASAVHRVGHALWAWRPTTASGAAARSALRVVHWVLNRRIESTTGISIAERAEIGPGLHIAHFGGVVVGQVRLGTNCNLSQGVTIGRGGGLGSAERPRLGDRCWVGPGAVIAGGVEVGNDAVVGANAVVTKSVPPRATAVGSPLSLLEERPSFGRVLYAGADDDEPRAASLRAHAAALAVRRAAHQAAAQAAQQAAQQTVHLPAPQPVRSLRTGA